jgi:hypothetical protein
MVAQFSVGIGGWGTKVGMDYAETNSTRKSSSLKRVKFAGNST